MKGDRSERLPSVRRVQPRTDGTLVTVEYDHGGRVVRESYYWSSDEELLARIRHSFASNRVRRSDETS